MFCPLQNEKESDSVQSAIIFTKIPNASSYFLKNLKQYLVQYLVSSAVIKILVLFLELSSESSQHHFVQFYWMDQS